MLLVSTEKTEVEINNTKLTSINNDSKPELLNTIQELY